MNKLKFILMFIAIFLFNIVNIYALTEEEIEKIKIGELKLTYELMGATGDGITNDYSAIQATHELANRIYLEDRVMTTVYGTSGKTYYISIASKPIKIITNVDWQNCNFILDDYVDLDSNGENDVNTSKSIFLIVSNMSEDAELRRITSNFFYVDASNEINELNFKINQYVKDYSPLIQALKNTEEYKTKDYIKKDFDNSRYWGVNIIAKEPYMYIRSGNSANNGDLQRETILVDTLTGELLTDLNWEYNSFSKVEIFPIRNEEIEVKNARFLTLTNNIAYTNNGIKKDYNHRNIKVQYSGNVRISNIKHKLDENAHLNINEYQDNPDGNAYAGFIATNSVALINIKDVYLSSHIMPSPSKWGSSYDLRFDNSVYIYVDNVNYFCDTVDNECFNKYMLDDKRWGITATNYIKNFHIKNSKLNRIDSHKGVTNLFVKDSTIGIRGVTLIGKGTIYIKNTIIENATSIIKLRNDYGSTFDGNIVLKDVTFIPKNTSNISIINSQNNQTHYYGYASTFPNVFIDGLHIKNENKNMINEMSLISLVNVSDVVAGEDNKRYYFKDKIYAKNISIDEKKLRLFSSYFEKRNYLISTYGGNNTVNMFLDSNIERDDSLLSLENSKFKIVSSMEPVFEMTEKISTKLYNNLSTSKLSFEFSDIGIDNLNNILKISQVGSKIKMLFDSTINNDTLQVYSKGDDLLYSDSIQKEGVLTTGQYVKYYDIIDGIKKYKISVIGDPSGDGKVNYMDYVSIYNHIKKIKHPELNKKLLEKEYFISADMNSDSKINYMDYVLIYNFIKNSKKIKSS